MASVSTTWDASKPAGGDDAKNGDDEIRNFKSCMVERMRNGGHRMQAAGSTVNEIDGRHVCGEAQAAGSASGLVGEWVVYAADGTTKVFTVTDSTAASVSKVDCGVNQLIGTGGMNMTTASTNTLNNLTVSNATTLSGALGVTGVTTVSDIIKPNANNTIDLGVDTTNAWRDLFVARNAKIGGTLVVTGAATFNGGIGAVTDVVVTNSLTNNGKTAGNFLNLTGGGATTALGATDTYVLAHLSGGNHTLTLPAAASHTGRHVYVALASVDTNARTVTIDPNGSEQIGDVDGGAATTYQLGPTSVGSNIAGVHLLCDGTRWVVMSATTVTMTG